MLDYLNSRKLRDIYWQVQAIEDKDGVKEAAFASIYDNGDKQAVLIRVRYQKEEAAKFLLVLNTKPEGYTLTDEEFDYYRNLTNYDNGARAYTRDVFMAYRELIKSNLDALEIRMEGYLRLTDGVMNQTEWDNNYLAINSTGTAITECREFLDSFYGDQQPSVITQKRFEIAKGLNRVYNQGSISTITMKL